MIDATTTTKVALLVARLHPSKRSEFVPQTDPKVASIILASRL